MLNNRPDVHEHPAREPLAFEPFALDEEGNRLKVRVTAQIPIEYDRVLDPSTASADETRIVSFKPDVPRTD